MSLSLLLGAFGCRGTQSASPPFRVFDDMDEQPKYKPEAESMFFADGRALRQPVEGTVARGELHADTAYWDGKVKTATGWAYVGKIPPAAGKVDEAFIRHGQERFNIYCSPCHDRTGSGHGMVIQRGFYIPVKLYSDHTRGISDGEIFNYITHGIRNMPSYAVQVPVQDRWSIVSWVRVLQRSQHASPSDVPPGTQILPQGDEK